MNSTTSSIAPSPSLAEQAAANLRHPLALALLALTFSTGTVDAVSYLGLGHVFTANMTGNVVLLGFGIARAGGLPIVAPIVSTVAFVLGAGVGGVLARRLADRHRIHIAYTIGLEAALLAGATILAAASHPHPATLAADGTIAFMAAGMGIRNATVRRLAVPDLTTTVLTLTITGLAADSTIAGGTGKGTLRRSSAVVAMLAGAISGALMLRTGLTPPWRSPPFSPSPRVWRTCTSYVGPETGWSTLAGRTRRPCHERGRLRNHERTAPRAASVPPA
jgi:uncharacterized membrane protein YoaK (UPF0700 family)